MKTFFSILFVLWSHRYLSVSTKIIVFNLRSQLMKEQYTPRIQTHTLHNARFHMKKFWTQTPRRALTLNLTLRITNTICLMNNTNQMQKTLSTSRITQTEIARFPRFCGIFGRIVYRSFFVQSLIDYRLTICSGHRLKLWLSYFIFDSNDSRKE